MDVAHSDTLHAAEAAEHSAIAPFKGTSRALLCVLVASVLIPLAGCDRGDVLGPPVIHYGQHECVVCRMIISDERYAAAAITLDVRGRHEPLVFDDIGCIFEYEAGHPDAPILARYVRHRSGEQWLDAEAAEFVHSRDLHTPMAFGLAAVGTLQEARSLQSEVGGDLIALDEARRRFSLGTLHVSALDGSQPFITSLESEKVIALDDGRELRLSLAIPQVLPPGTHDFAIDAERRENDRDWRPATAVALAIEPEMPSMGHGSPGNEHPVHIADGRFRGRVNFTMAGHWLVHVEIHEGGRALGRTSFAFEVRR